MFSKSYKLYQITRNFSQSTSKFANLKVTVCGAAGRTGQTVSLLLKSCPLIDELALFDIKSTAGIGLELSHIDTKCKVHTYKKNIEKALKNANIVAIVASAPKLSGIDTPFKPNADIISQLITATANFAPNAFIAIGTNPVNSLVPLASEILQKHGVYNDKHVFGVTTLHVMRTNAIVARKTGLVPENVHVPVIGGYSKSTVVPLLSCTSPKTKFSREELMEITNDVQNASEQIYNQTLNYTPFLAGSLAISQFVISLVRAIKGEERVIESCFVRSKVYPNLEYLSTPVVLGIDGIQKNLGIPEMTDYEKCLFQSCRENLLEEIREGEDYVNSKNQICN